MPVETPPDDFVGAVHDATALGSPVVEQVATEIWNVAVKPRLSVAATKVDPREDVNIYGAKAPLAAGGLLTGGELSLLDRLSGIVRDFTEVYEADVQRGDSRPSIHSHDMNEVVAHIHDLQARVLSRAAARAYPGKFRLL